MNKQQLIDKAIDDLGGEFKPKGKYVILGGDILAIAYIGSEMQCVCGRQEFQARKAEREAQQHWYDYEHQKALRFPPVGEVVLFREIEEDEKATVIAHHNDSVICEVYGRYRGFSAESLRPIDWDRLIADDLHPLVDLLRQHEAFTFRGIALAILAAGYRKCDNKTSLDKE